MYGHHTENISDVEKWVTGGSVSRSDVKEVIKREIASGRLKNHGGHPSVSITTDKNKLLEIIDKYSAQIKQTALKNLETLSKGKYPAGG